MSDKMMTFRVVGEPIYGKTVFVPLGYDWAKGDPPKPANICGIPVYGSDGNPYDFKRSKGMWFTEELLADAGIKVNKESDHAIR